MYTTWFEHTKLKIIDDNKVVIIVPMKIQKRYLSEHYRKMINDYLLMETDEIDEVSFALEDELTAEEYTEYVARHAIKI